MAEIYSVCDAVRGRQKYIYTHRADQDLEVHVWKGSAARMQRQARREIGACAVACHSKCEAARPHSQLSGVLMHLRHTVSVSFMLVATKDLSHRFPLRQTLDSMWQSLSLQ